MTDSDIVAVRVRIRGRVQGVGYRDWTQRRAVGLTLRGWVRNRTDGSVEALFIGARSAVDRMVADCWHGPSLARVQVIDTDPEAVPACDSFTRRPTT
ncbi:acylphosphatase [Reyranella sp. CPCC 100927]|uniref:acylphosphatase n=1 Tax=Reyranella sp. CPCC 100927 TaxID=2599616 RepID=UPI0011B5241D|nr:acylphosphatase [Reyranella sp. CPCC 100927]TWT05691.1 acylphosphatase [Reyranella sp. CPCC 100927]